MSGLPENKLSRVLDCVEKASRVDPDSPHRRELRRILAGHELELARALLLAHELLIGDVGRTVRCVPALRAEAQELLEPFLTEAPR